MMYASTPESTRRILTFWQITILTVCILLSSSRSEALEQGDLCWKGVCAGMTLTEVKSQLKSLGYDVNNRWLARMFERLMPNIGGVFPFEGHTEWISAKRGADCHPYAPARKSCSSIELEFVRFPSGQPRLVSFQVAETISGERYASEMIDELIAGYGQPDREGWKRWPEGGPSKHAWILWKGHWSGENLGEWLRVDLHVDEKLNVENGKLSPPEISQSLQIDSIDFMFHSLQIGREAESAWDSE
jgi:hypothetical protein